MNRIISVGRHSIPVPATNRFSKSGGNDCAARAAWMTAILQPSTRRSKDVHCHEPLPGEEGIRTGIREGVAQPRLTAEQGAGLRRIPPAEGTRARGLHALCVAYGLAEPECLRSVDQVGGISRRPQ